MGAPDSPTTDRDLSGRTLGEFVLREQIGEGGYGVVYRCEQRALRRQAVVKVLRRHDLVARERFLREAQLASRLEHPYAAHVYAFGAEPDGVLWIAMELVPGVTLKDWLETHGPMPLEQFVPFFECVAEVVHAAHERGIVHRDLKPSNMMVIERGERLIPKLLDFGIAKVEDLSSLGWPDGSLGDGDGSGGRSPRGGPLVISSPAVQPPEEPTRTASEPLVAAHGAAGAAIDVGPRTSIASELWLTRTGIGIGSRAYMSPEQWRDAARVGPASDIYSLGVVAYQALTGRIPFGAEQPHGQSALQGSEVSPLGPGFSMEMEAAIRRALAKQPGDRQRSALELAAALRTALRTQPREQLRSLAQVWDAQARPAALLLKGSELLHAKAETTGELGELERAFIGASRRQATRRIYWRRLGVGAAVAVVLVVAAVLYRARLQAQFEHQLAEESITRAEIEQGRQALLHDETMEAQTHLWQAYQRGARTPDVKFMLARSLQTKMAERAQLSAVYGRMWSAAFSPDGVAIVTSDDRSAQVWDAGTYKLRLILAHSDIVYQAVYSRDGMRIVTVCRDGVVRTWDVNTGTLIRELRGSTPASLGLQYFRLAVSPDDRLVAAIDVHGAFVHVWDMFNGVNVAELANDNSDFPAVVFSEDGNWLISGGGDDVRVFDTKSWRQVLKIAGAGIRALSLDPMSSRLVTGTSHGDVSIWQIPGGARLTHLREVGESIDAVAFSSDGRMVVSASRDGAEQVWDASSGKLLTQLNCHRGKVQSIEFDQKSRLVVSAGTDGKVVLSDVALGMVVAILEGPLNVIRAAHFEPNGLSVIGASWDGTARIWSAAPPYRRWSSLPVSDGCGVVSGLRPDDRYIAVSCKELPTRIWDTARDRLLREVPNMTPIGGDVGAMFPAISTEGERVAIARGNTVEVYSVVDGRLICAVHHSDAVSAVAFDPLGHDLVSGSVDGTIFFTRGRCASVMLAKSSGAIDVVALLGDGRVVFSDSERRMKVYDIRRALLVADLAAPNRSMLLRTPPPAGSSFGGRLLSLATYTSSDPPILWDLQNYKIVARLEGHVGLVESARFVRNGQDILTSGADGTVRMWDSSVGRLRQTYRGSRQFLADAVLDPSGSIVVAGGGDGILYFWDMETARPLWMMKAHRSYIVGVHFEANDIVTRGFGGELARWEMPEPQQIIEEWRRVGLR